MQNKAARFHGTNDIRVDTYELPELGEGEVLLKVCLDSCCMSSYKAAIQGTKHKRIPKDVAEHPTIVGHEFCGEIVKIGKGCEGKYEPGQKAALQTTLPNTFMAPGYSYEFCGGETQYAIIPKEFTDAGNLILYKGAGFFPGALAEPYSCVSGAFHANYHNVPGKYIHTMGIKENGKLLLLAATGPLGLAAIDYILHCDRKPKELVVTGRSAASLGRAEKLFPVEEAGKNGVTLQYYNVSESEDNAGDLRRLSGGEGYDDVFVMIPDKEQVELGDSLLAFDGCLNIFSGPTEKGFSVPINAYDIHYSYHHVCGISGGNAEDMAEVIAMMNEGKLHPSALVSHVGGLDAAPETTMMLPKIKGGKKLIYTDISMPLTAIADFEELGKGDPLFRKLHELCERSGGLWSVEAEAYLRSEAKKI